MTVQTPTVAAATKARASDFPLSGPELTDDARNGILFLSVGY